LQPWQLPELLDVVVIEGSEADGSAMNSDSPGTSSGRSVAIPVALEVC
jgi:hypothetical protein